MYTPDAFLGSIYDLKGFLPGSAPCPGPSLVASSPQALPVPVASAGGTGDGDLPETQPGLPSPVLPPDWREDSQQIPGDICETPAPGVPDPTEKPPTPQDENEKPPTPRDENEKPPTPGDESVPATKCVEKDAKKRTREDDEFAPTSVPPEVLSEKAIYNRIYRVFVKRSDGSYLLDDEWVKSWNDVHGGGRDQLYYIFEKVGYNRDQFDQNISNFNSQWYWPTVFPAERKVCIGPVTHQGYPHTALQDKLIKRCRAITEKISEEISEIEGEWLTLLDMQNLNFSEPPSLIGENMYWSRTATSSSENQNSYVIPLDKPNPLRTKIKGVTRYCESRQHLTRLGI